METLTVLTRLGSMLSDELIARCPIMSGNMRSSIESIVVTDNELQIVINAKPYDIKRWKDTGQIVFKSGKDYALDVERFGGFFSFNKSMGWVERTIEQVVNAIASSVNAEVVYNLNKEQ